MSSNVDVKRLVIKILRGTKAENGCYGFGDFALDTDSVLSEVYTSPEYDDSDRAVIKANLERIPMVDFVRGYFVRNRKLLPCICVVRQTDEEDRAPLGRLTSTNGTAPNELFYAEKRGARHRESLKFEVRAAGKGSPGIRDYLYHGLRWLIQQSYPTLHAAGVLHPSWKSGRDGDMGEDQELHIIHRGEAYLNYRIKREHNVVMDRGLGAETNTDEYGGGTTPVELSS